MRRYNILDDAEITREIAALPNWQFVTGEIVADYVFGSFREAIGFIVQIAFLAEELDHHPEILNSYNKLKLRLCTHDVGNKITDVDIEMAKRLATLYKVKS